MSSKALLLPGFPFRNRHKILSEYFLKEKNLPGGSDGKASAYNAGDLGSISESERSPGEGMAIHPSTLAWKIPWTEEPGGLQSMGSRRVGHD